MPVHPRVLGFAAAMAVLSAACTQSRVDPGADVVVAGRLLRPDGTPAPNREVIVLSEPTASDIAFGLPFGLGSLGVICLADDPPPPCDTRRSTTTAADGTFGFEMKGRDTQGLLGEAAVLMLAAGLGPGDGQIDGPATTARFNVQSERFQLPEVRTWGPQLTLSSEGGTGRVTWQVVTPEYGRLGGYRIAFGAEDRNTVWAAPAAAGSYQLDARILEDSQGGVSVVAEARVRATGTDVRFEYRTQTVPYLSSAGAPSSRGASCSAASASGLAAQLAPCRLTDGQLWRAFGRS